MERNAAMGQVSGTLSTPRSFGRKDKVSSINAGLDINFGDLTKVQKELQGVTSSLKELKTTLNAFASSQATLGASIKNMMGSIRNEAKTTADTLRDLTGATKGVTGGSGGSATPKTNSVWGASSSPPPTPPSGGGGGNSGGGGTGSYYGGISPGTPGKGTGGLGAAFAADNLNMGSMGSVLGGMFNNATSEITGPLDAASGGALSLIGNLLMMPLTYAKNRITTNRVQALGMSQQLTPLALATGQSVTDMTDFLSKRPGKMLGTISDFLGATSIGANLGMYNNAPTGAGNQANSLNPLLNNIGFLQQYTPGLGAGQVGGMIAGQYRNIGSQQRSAFYTSGAFSMVKQGGGMKSIQEWAEGILRWLENQRPGDMRGKPFDYGSLLSQNFPGSNVNAWFQSMGVDQNMIDYFWFYALQKTKDKGSTQAIFTKPDMGGNFAYRRSKAGTVGTTNEFQLASKMSPLYATREISNEWFNKLTGAVSNRAIPASFGPGGPMSLISMLPDPVESFLWNMLTNSGPLGAVLGGGLSAAGMLTNATTRVLTGNSTGPASSGDNAAGDIGDVGDSGKKSHIYGAYGSQSTAGLTPDLRAKVENMLKANPRLQINSGLRDSFTQSKLKAKGIGTFKAGGMSQHAGGWAADIGPRSEYKWLQSNANKFGLETADRYGEPWHVQVSGTLAPARTSSKQVGDIGGDGMDVGGFGLGNPFKGLTKVLSGVLDGIKLISKVFGAVIEGFTKMKDLFFGGIFDIGKLLGGGGSVKGLATDFLGSLLGMGAGGISVSTDEGGAETSTASPPVPVTSSLSTNTGDIGDYGSLIGTDRSASSGTSIQFHNQITIPVTTSGPAANLDLKRIASQLADQLEIEMNRRLARTK